VHIVQGRRGVSGPPFCLLLIYNAGLERGTLVVKLSRNMESSLIGAMSLDLGDEFNGHFLQGPSLLCHMGNLVT
jgi:hypothetical protein